MSVNPTQNRLSHAHVMCLRFRQLEHWYALNSAGDFEISSRHPPTRCRNEWQPNVYPPSRITLITSTNDPTPMPNEPLPVAASVNQKPRIASMLNMTMKSRAMYMKYR